MKVTRTMRPIETKTLEASQARFEPIQSAGPERWKPLQMKQA
ncbi:hypothetical protein [Sinomonas sp. ASV322]|nr:hypothetical protein [Sinomonas sp. ASV322]MDQ4502203.1 hypothetical protein [Sinomonas sp. ASV322]